MATKLKKFGLAFLALGLFCANTDYVVIPTIKYLSNSWGESLAVAIVVANIQATLWYFLGRGLVGALADFYLPLVRWEHKQRVWIFRQVLHWLGRGVRSFYYWEESKKKVDAVIDAIFASPKVLASTFLVWIFFPVRTASAIAFGMDRRLLPFLVLVCANVIHVILSFAVGSGVTAVARWIWSLFF